MDASSDDPRKELDSYASMVVLGPNSFLFDSTRRTCNVQPFSSDLDMTMNSQIVDGTLARDSTYSG